MRRDILAMMTVNMGGIAIPSPVPSTEPPPGNQPWVVAAWARGVMNAFRLNDWSFGYDNAKRRYGCCSHGRKAITLSRHYLLTGTAADFRDTLLHEIAHALAGPHHGHDATWEAICRRIGCKPERCGKSVAMPEGKWSATCGGCGLHVTRHRKPKRMDGWSCRKCGRVRGKLTWVLGTGRG